MDIRMPVLNGIDFIKVLKNPPAVIIKTAYREYALDGYDLDIIDYLLKPISFDRFLKAVDRFRNRKDDNSGGVIARTSGEVEPLDHIFFNVNKTYHKVRVDDIIYIESLKDYVRIHMKDDKLVVKGNLGSTLKLLRDVKFLRIHRSFVIAKEYVKSYNQSEVEVGGRSYQSE